MPDVKTWLEQAGEPVADTAFVDEVPLPFLVFRDTVNLSGADNKNFIKHHSLTIERYSENCEDNSHLEILLQFIPYTKEKMWLKDMDCFMTVYDLDFTEKI